MEDAGGDDAMGILPTHMTKIGVISLACTPTASVIGATDCHFLMVRTCVCFQACLRGGGVLP